MIIYLIILILNFSLSLASDLDSILTSQQDSGNRNLLSSSYKIEQWLTSEGDGEGNSEIWLDRYFNQHHGRQCMQV